MSRRWSRAPDDDVDTMHRLLDDAGCLVVRDLASAEQIAAVRADLAPHVDAAVAGEDDPEDFYPGKTHRVVAIMHRSPTLRDLMMPGAEISGFLLPNWLAAQSPIRVLGALRTVRRLMVDGLFDTEVTETFDLDQVGAAVAAATQPGRTGKVMLRIGEP